MSPPQHSVRPSPFCRRCAAITPQLRPPPSPSLPLRARATHSSPSCLPPTPLSSSSITSMRVHARLHVSSSGGVRLSLHLSPPPPPAAAATLTVLPDGTVSLSLRLLPPPRPSRRLERGRQAAARASLASVCFDLSLAALMSDAETRALARQLALCYGHNRRLERPVQLALAGVGEACGAVAALERWGWRRWALRRLDDGAIAAGARGAFEGRRLVYLSADSERVLQRVEEDAVYVIGALVDHKPKARAAWAHASERGVRTARLPLEGVVRLRKPALTCSAVLQILAGYVESGCWEKAIRNSPAMHEAPLKKYVQWL